MSHPPFNLQQVPRQYPAYDPPSYFDDPSARNPHQARLGLGEEPAPRYVPSPVQLHGAGLKVPSSEDGSALLQLLQHKNLSRGDVNLLARSNIDNIAPQGRLSPLGLMSSGGAAHEGGLWHLPDPAVAAVGPSYPTQLATPGPLPAALPPYGLPGHAPSIGGALASYLATQGTGQISAWDMHPVPTGFGGLPSYGGPLHPPHFPGSNFRQAGALAGEYLPNAAVLAKRQQYEAALNHRQQLEEQQQQQLFIKQQKELLFFQMQQQQQQQQQVQQQQQLLLLQQQQQAQQQLQQQEVQQEQQQMQQEQHWQGSSEVHADGQHVVSEQGSARPSLSGSELLSLLQGSRSRSMPRPQSSSDTQTHAKPADATSLENHNSEQDSQYGAFAFGTGQPLEAGKEGAGRGAVAHGPIGPPSKQPQTQAAAAAAASWLGDSPSAHSFGPLFGVPQQLHAGHPPGFPDARDRIFNPGTAPLPPGPLAASSSSPGPGPGPAGLLGLGAVGGLSQDPDTDQGGALSSSVNGSASRASATGANQRGLQDAIMARQLDPPPLEPPPPAFASSSDQIFSGRPKGGRGGNASSLGPPGPAAHHLQEQQSPVSGRAVGRPARASSSSGAPPGPAVAPAASDGRPLAGAPRRNSGGTDPLLMKRQGGATAAKPASGDQRAPASDRSAAVPGEGGHSGPASLAELAEPRGAGMWAPGGPLAPNWGEEGLPTDQAGGTMGGQNGGGPLLRDEGKGHGNGSASQGHEGSSKWTPRPMEVPAWLLTQPEAAGQHDSEHGQHNAGAGLVLAQNGQPHARAQASGEGRSLEVSLAEELQVPPLASQIDRPVTVDALSSEPGDAILQAKRQVAALQEQQELLSAAELGELSLGGERGEQQQQQQHGAGNGGTSIWDPVDHAAAGKRSSGGDSWPQRGGLSRAVNGFMGGQVAVAQQLEERRPEAGGPSDRAENAREAAESQLVVQPGGIQIPGAQKDSRSRLISSESPVGSSSPAAFSYPSTSPTMMRMGSFQGRQSLDGGGRARGEMELITRSLVALCDSLIPTAGEEMRRRLFLARLDQLVARSWAHAKLFLFGSCANAFGVRDSDIDVCLSVDDPQASKANLIARMANILRSDGMQNVQALTHARVPVVKFMDAGTGISCDICVNNMLAVANTKLLHDYAQVDRRLRQLAYLVKHWAKQRQINETYRGTLSSYA